LIAGPNCFEKRQAVFSTRTRPPHRRRPRIARSPLRGGLKQAAIFAASRHSNGKMLRKMLRRKRRRKLGDLGGIFAQMHGLSDFTDLPPIHSNASWRFYLVSVAEENCSITNRFVRNRNYFEGSEAESIFQLKSASRAVLHRDCISVLQKMHFTPRPQCAHAAATNRSKNVHILFR
jgi:hypothetical protein